MQNLLQVYSKVLTGLLLMFGFCIPRDKILSFILSCWLAINLQGDLFEMIKKLMSHSHADKIDLYQIIFLIRWLAPPATLFKKDFDTGPFCPCNGLFLEFITRRHEISQDVRFMSVLQSKSSKYII